jgi:hypothetical protein
MTDITGRDSYIIMQALVYSSEFLAALPELYDEPSNRWDMDDLLKSRIDPACIEHYRKLAREKLAAVNLRRKHDEFTN